MASNPHDPAIYPHTGISEHPSHCDNSEKRKKGGVVGGKQGKKRSPSAENNRLKKKQRPHKALPNLVTNSHNTKAA